MAHFGATACINATLQRADTNTSWGFRLRGGVDFHSPVIIERVIQGSLADRCGLRPGDVIRGICGEPTSHMRHQDAHDAVLRGGNYLKMELLRQSLDGGHGHGYEDDRATSCSSATWSRAGSKGQSHTPATEVSSSTVLDSYETSDGGHNKQTIQQLLEKDNVKPEFENEGKKLYERERPKEVAAVVEEFKHPPVVSVSSKNGAPHYDDIDNANNRESTRVRPSVWCSPRRQSTQSKSFLKLQSLLESGDDDVRIPRPTPNWQAPPPSSYRFISGVVKSESDIDVLRPENNDDVDDGPVEDFPGLTVNARPYSTTTASPLPFSSTTPAYRPKGQQPGFPFSSRTGGQDLNAPPPVPVPRRSPAPRPLPSGPLSGQPRAFRPGAAVRTAAVNPASRVPICHRCSRNIRGPFIVALDKTFCPDHFNCNKCGCDMVDVGFVETPDGHIYCEDDYGRYMAPRCHRCREAIIGTIVKALSAEWHTDCFVCAHCNKSIAGGLFHIEDGKPYCEKDYAAMFQTKCKGCDFPIEPGDRWLEAAGENYHATCFNCTTCQCTLANRGFVMKNGKPYCTPHSRGL